VGGEDNEYAIIDGEVIDAELPAAFVATIVNVYVTPSVKPLNVAVVVIPLIVFTITFPGVEVIV
jgi:hypothetical protein